MWCCGEMRLGEVRVEVREEKVKVNHNTVTSCFMELNLVSTHPMIGWAS